MTISLREQRTSEVLRVEIKATNLMAVVFDEMGDVRGPDLPAKFLIADPIDGISVRVWQASTPEGPWVLWHEEDHHFIREISGSMNLMGLTGRLSSDWLERIGQSKNGARADALVRIQQVGHHQKMLTSNRQPWELAIRQTRKAVQRVFPDPSGAVFFKKGWEGDSKLAFAEWIQKELSNHHGRVILLDPYFDVPGLDLIARASGAAEEIVVVTCSQIPSDDDNLQPTVTRADRLRRECKQLAPILAGIRLRIVDLRSKAGGKGQVFHDRYALFYESDTELSKGYHLSTSLQSATRTTPLLVTPIPTDTLDDVADYVADLLTVDATTTNQILLHPSATDAPQPWPNDKETAALTSFLQSIGSLPTPLSDSEGGLVESGLLHERRITLKWDVEHVVKVAAAMEAKELPDQAQIWCGLCEARAHGSGIDGLVEALASRPDTPLANFLPRYLHAIALGKADPGSARPARQVLRTLAHVFAGDYRAALKNAETFYDHVHRHPIGTTWAIYFGTEALARFFPSRVDALIVDVPLPSAASEEVLSALAVAAVEVVREDNPEVISAFLRAETPFLRALAYVSLWRSVQQDHQKLHVLVAAIGTFTTEDRAWALSRSVYEIRVRANQGRAEESDRATLRGVIDLFIDAFVHLGVTVSIQNFIPELSGPVNGSWAQSTNDEVLVPMIEKGFLTEEALLDIWSTVLDEKIASETSHFFPSTDVELLDVWAQAFWRATDAQRDVVVAVCGNDVERAQRTLDEPFLASRDYDRWRGAADRIIWWLLRWGAVRHHRPATAPPQAVDESTKVVRQAVLDNRLVESAIGEFQPAAAAVLEVLR